MGEVLCCECFEYVVLVVWCEFDFEVGGCFCVEVVFFEEVLFGFGFW